MNRGKITNLPASIRQRLLDLGKASGRPFQDVLQYYAMERFLARLSQSTFGEKFILKGALLLSVWRVANSRTTRDIDLLGRVSNEIDEIVAVFRSVCNQPVEPDALEFDTNTVAGTAIKEDAEYSGVRVTFRGSLQNVRIPMQVDIGFGDVVHPVAEFVNFPTLLDHAPPRIRGYHRETVIAEKFEAMVKLGLFNSRMKDFYDIWWLSNHFDFQGVQLRLAIEKTFANRGTHITSEPTAFSDAFASDSAKVAQWKGFLTRSLISDAPNEFATV